MDKILLSGIRLAVHLGVPVVERSRPQEVQVDLELEFDTRKAGQSDHFHDTVDYAAVLDTVHRAATEKSYALVECMAERIAAAVLAEFPVQSARVLLKKPGALRDRGVDYAAVEITRTRHD